MADLHDLLANSPPEAKELITTSFREKTEAALQVGIKYLPNSDVGRAYRRSRMFFGRAGLKGKGSAMQRFVFAASEEEAQEAAEAAQVKIQFENLLEVKEQMQRIVLGHHKEAAEAVSAQLVQGVRTK